MSSLILPAILGGLTTGAIYALIALGLTLIYGVLHIINFAHGSLLMLALYGVYFLHVLFGVDPYLAIPIIVPSSSSLVTPFSAASSRRSVAARSRTSSS